MTNENTNSLIELASGVDALYASSRPNISNDFFGELLSLKEEASLGDFGFSGTDIGTEHYHVGSGAWGKYPVYLEHEFGRIGFTQSSSLPGVRLQIRSKFLHNMGAEKALLWFTNRLEEMGILTYWTLSRLDLYMDLQGWSPKAEDEPNFLTRATEVNYYKQKDEFSGFRFGARKSGTILCRIYNKTLELEKKTDGWTPLIWGDRVDYGRTVWRVEFEMGTKLLSQVGITTALQGLERMGGLWAYATEDWLTLRIPNDDSNKSRWHISEPWQFIQNSTLRGSEIPIERIRDGQTQAALQALLSPFKGYLTSIGTHLGATNFDDTFESAKNFVRKNEKSSKNTIEEILLYKRQKFFL